MGCLRRRPCVRRSRAAQTRQSEPDRRHRPLRARCTASSCSIARQPRRAGHHLAGPAQPAPGARNHRAHVGAERLYSITGSPLSTGFLAASVRWMQQEAPALVAPGADAAPAQGLPALAHDRRHCHRSQRRRRLAAAGRTAARLVGRRCCTCSTSTAATCRSCSRPTASPATWWMPRPHSWACRPASPSSPAPPTPPAACWAPARSPPTGCCSASAPGGQLVQPVDEVRVDRLGRIHTFCSALAPGARQAGWYQMGATLNAGHGAALAARQRPGLALSRRL